MSKKFEEKLNEKMQVKLPDNLNNESILSQLPDMEEKIVEIPKKLTAKKVIPMVASFAIIIGLLGTYFGLGFGKEKEPESQPSDVIEVMHYSSYDKIYEKFDELHNESTDLGFNVEVYEGAIDESADDFLVSPGETTGTNNFSGKDFGMTNNQEIGVDEGDIIKTDGNYLYVINGGSKSLAIVDIRNDKMTVAAKISIDENEIVSKIYLNGNNLVLVGRSYRENYKTGYSDKAVMEDTMYPVCSAGETFVKIYDVSDKKAPELLNEFSQQGSYVSSRMIGTKFYAISTRHVDIYSDDYREYCIPEITVAGKNEKIPADCIMMVENSKNPTYAIVSVVDLNNSMEPSVEAVLGGCSEVYATVNGMFLSETDYFSESTSTNIYRFDYTDNGVKYIASGRVDGFINDQFSMSYDGEYFRIATTSNKEKANESGDVISRTTVNNLYILDDQMRVVGSVEDLAEGEHIKSVRFVGDMAYVVTFVQTDPLFVIDLSDPTNPTVKGELKIPGFSQYLHPITPTLLVGVGRDGTESGENDDCKVSLFDVSNPYEPKESSVLKFGIENGAYCYSYVENNHRMYINLGENEFAVPFAVRKYVYGGTSGIESGDYYVRYKLENGKLCEVSRYHLGQYLEILGATYVDDVFYVVNVNYGSDGRRELAGTYVTAYSLKTNEKISEIKVEEWI